jgi:carboxylesterase
MQTKFPISPARNYAEAVERIEVLKVLDHAADVDPQSASIFLSHGVKAERAILLLHGYTSSPRLYIQLAEAFFQRGYNVLVPRFPYHGLKDRLTGALANQSEDELLSFTNAAVDITQGLGEQVSVAGLSMGGVLTLWVAAHRADVFLACAIAPALAFHAFPLAITPAVVRFFLLAPNQFRWWDGTMMDVPMPPLHTYPRFATRGLAQIANIGLKVRELARQARPRAGSVVIVTNPTDENVNNRYAHEIARYWSELGAPGVSVYEFDARYNLIHDLIDPDQPKQQTALVYPILLDLIAGNQTRI